MSRPARLILVVSVLYAGSLLVASLALVSILPSWGLLFFYVLPSSFVALWGAREVVPSAWRLVATPARRAWRLSPLAGHGGLPPIAATPAPRPETPAQHRAALAVAARLWLRGMRPVFSMLRSQRGRRIRDAAVIASGLALIALVLRELAVKGWPAKELQPVATAAACSFFLSTFALRALGWQRLFRPVERPRSLVLVTSTGTAEVVSLALPPRIGDAIGVSIVRKLTVRRAPSIGTTVLSLFVLGLMDIASIVPLAVYAGLSVHGAGVRIAMLVVIGVGTGAAMVAAALPSVRTSARLTRRGFGHWLALHAPVSRRDALWSWLLVCGSWLTRAAALLLLLDALGLHPSFALAAAYVAAGAGANALPVGPAGAATEAGAGAAVLAGAGIATPQAIALAATAQGLTAASGGVLALFGASLLRARRKAA